MKFIAALTVSFATLASTAAADSVEVMLTDRLDGNLDFYCLDISGSKTNANVENGLQTHTCYGYQGEAGVDQVFDVASIEEARLYMPEWDVCATVSDLAVGASIELAACDGGDMQNIALTDDGHLSPISAMDLCFTAGEETTRGRGGTSDHQIKSLTLQTCSDDRAGYQTWELRAE